MESEFRCDLKIIVIGPPASGKTSFVNKWTKNKFSETYKATIISEFGFKICQNKNSLYRIQMWDIGGQDKSLAMTKIFSRDSHGCLLICDVTKINEINEIISWKEAVDDSSKFLDNGTIPCILIQNKCDLIDENEYNKYDDINKSYCKENNFDGCFMCSVKEGKNIDEAMDFLIEKILDRMEKYANEGNEVFNNQVRRDTIKLKSHRSTNVSYRNSKGSHGSCCTSENKE